MPLNESMLLPLAREAAQEALETMFFTDAVPVACEHGPAEALVAARVCFSGQPAGEMSLVLTRDLARALAAGFLGVDAHQLGAEEESQVACELANILCGAVLSRVHPDSGVALSAPESVIPRFPDDGEFHQCFRTPEGALTISMRLQEERVP